MKFIIIVLFTFFHSTLYAASPIPSPEITILVSSLGKEGEQFPVDLTKFWEIISINQDTKTLEAVPIIKVTRIDLAEEKEFILPKNDSWVDKLVKPDPRINLKKLHDFLEQSKISKELSNSIPSEEGQIIARKAKFSSDIPTVLEITNPGILEKNQFLTVPDLLASLKKNISQDLSTGNASKYLVFYKLDTENKSPVEANKMTEVKAEPGIAAVEIKSTEPSLETKQRVKQGMVFVSLAKQNPTTRSENIKNALVEFDAAVKQEEAEGRCFASAYMNRGIAYWQDKKLNLAEKDLIKASECDGKDPIIFYNIASYYSAINKTDLALEPLDKALELGFKDCEVLRKDSDLKNLRKQDDFRRILEKQQLFCLR